MAAVERTYTIPLRKEWLKSVRYKRAKKAVRAIKEFLVRHMKAEEGNIRIMKHLNLELWKHGIQNPPSKVKVNVTKDDKGIVTAELFGAPKEEKKPEAPKKGEKKEEKKPVEEKKPEAPAPKAEEKKAAPEKPAVQKSPAPAKQAPAPVKQAPAPKQQAGQIIR